MKRLVMLLVGATALSLGHMSKADTLSHDGESTAHYFHSLQRNPVAQSLFLQNMPKGGDLHNHRSGSAYAENMLAAAMSDSQLCVDTATLSVVKKADCGINLRLKNLANDGDLYTRVINAWSLRNFIATPAESAHDHFFATFYKFLTVSSTHRGENLTELVNRAGQQHEQYVETMITSSAEKSIALGANVEWQNNLDLMYKTLNTTAFDQIVSSMRLELDQNEMYMRKALQCDTDNAAPGCKVVVRYQQIALRNMPPALVFAQLMSVFKIADSDPRVVAINMVGPEDGYYSLRDYTLHMQMVDYLHKLYPKANISLHAGELALGLVTPENLSFHITEAIHTAHAQRIGHGVDIVHETNAQVLLNEMAQKKVAVEICLTSNDLLLNVRGGQHPLPLYLKAGVPVVLATDDEGVFRSNLTREYQRAATTYNLDYATIKSLARNSLTYAFLDGNSVWQNPALFIPVDACSKDKLGAEKTSNVCSTYLQQNPKAKLQWKLEAEFAVFEKTMAKKYREQLVVR